MRLWWFVKKTGTTCFRNVRAICNYFDNRNLVLLLSLITIHSGTAFVHQYTEIELLESRRVDDNIV